MRQQNFYNKGISVVETLIILIIMSVIFKVAISSYSTMRSKKQVEVTIDSIESKLAEAKTNAIAGKNGNSFGLRFSSTTYIYFSGSYITNSASNSTSTIVSGLQISPTISDGSGNIIFSRLTGFPQATGTIVVRDLNGRTSVATITVGSLGDINMVK